VLDVALAIRDQTDRIIDPAELGIDRLVDLIRAQPSRSDGAPPGDGTLGFAVGGPSLLSLDAVERLSRQVGALRAACVAAVADDTPGGAGSDEVLDEVSCALVVSRRSAQHSRGVSETLRHQPEVWAALARGELDLTRARILASALFEVPIADPDGQPRTTYEAECATLFAEGLAYAQEHTARRLDLFLQRQLATLGCTERPRRRKQALAERGVWLSHRGDGTADLVARLASEDAERVYATIRGVALADRNGDPTHDAEHPREPMDIWLAAALVDVVLAPARAGDSGARSGADVAVPTWDSQGGLQTTINVTVPVESLAGLSDLPGVINGFGAIPAEDARRLAAGDSRWRHVLTSQATGSVLDVGTLSYRPPARLARHVRLRDGTCRFPGCEVPARECDLDHRIPFPLGSTSAENLNALCRRHHRLKHDGGWRVEAGPGSALRWTSPQGGETTTYPDDTHANVA